MYLVMGVGALLLMGGVAGLLLARKRRQRFEA
jgi:LPXTG-motif cell wall-anchored protein